MREELEFMQGQEKVGGWTLPPVPSVAPKPQEMFRWRLMVTAVFWDEIAGDATPERVEVDLSWNPVTGMDENRARVLLEQTSNGFSRMNDEPPGTWKLHAMAQVGDTLVGEFRNDRGHRSTVQIVHTEVV